MQKFKINKKKFNNQNAYSSFRVKHKLFCAIINVSKLFDNLCSAITCHVNLKAFSQLKFNTVF